MKNPATAPALEDWGYALCKECGRAFDLLDAEDAEDWYHGHDCEAS